MLSCSHNLIFNDVVVGKFHLKEESNLVFSLLSSPLQNWSKFHQIFSKMVDSEVDSTQLDAAPQNRRIDDDQYTDYHQY